MSAFLSITDVYTRLPAESKPDIMWLARGEGAMIDPDIAVSIAVTGRARAVIGWRPERVDRWLNQVVELTDGAGLRYRHLRWLRIDRKPWWDAETQHLATAADIAAVCPSTGYQAIRYRLRNPDGWWHAQAITLGNRTGWPLTVAREIIGDLDLPLDLTRWAHLSALAAPGPGPGPDDRDGHLAALHRDRT